MQTVNNEVEKIISNRIIVPSLTVDKLLYIFMQYSLSICNVEQQWLNQLVHCFKWLKFDLAKIGI